MIFIHNVDYKEHMNRPIGMQFQFGILKMGFETPFQRNTEEREGEEEGIL